MKYTRVRIGRDEKAQLSVLASLLGIDKTHGGFVEAIRVALEISISFEPAINREHTTGCAESIPDILNIPESFNPMITELGAAIALTSPKKIIAWAIGYAVRVEFTSKAHETDTWRSLHDAGDFCTRCGAPCA